MRLPEPGGARRWRRVVDTRVPAGQDFVGPGEEQALDHADAYTVNARSSVVLLARVES